MRVKPEEDTARLRVWREAPTYYREEENEIKRRSGRRERGK